MSFRSPNSLSSAAKSSNGADVVAACGPLQVIAASLLASHRDSKQAIQQACTLLETSKAFLPALQGFRAMLHVEYGPPATAEAVASFAGKANVLTALPASSAAYHLQRNMTAAKLITVHETSLSMYQACAMLCSVLHA
jgi:hypothetical protein